MLEVARLVGIQTAAVAVMLTLMLFVSHWVAPKSEAGFLLSTYLLTFAVIVAALWGIAVRPWWLYALLWFVALVALAMLGLVLFAWLEPDVMNCIGPGGTAYLLPFIAGFFAFPVGGVLNGLLGLARS
jgi:hypothetical protein